MWVDAFYRVNARRTGSRKAQELLDAWQAVAAKFVKLVPSEYRMALEAQQHPATNDVAALALPPSPPYVSTGRYVPAMRGVQ